MQRIRTRYPQQSFSNEYTHLTVPEYSFTENLILNTREDEIRDTNNGTGRPDSACHHVRATWEPERLFYVFDDKSMTFGGYSHRHAHFVRLVLEQFVSNQVQTHVESLTQDFYNKEIASFERFDGINAALGLANPAQYFKKLDKYRYLDWEFGLSPTLADAKEAYGRMHTTIESVNARLKSWEKPSPFRLRKNIDLTMNEELLYYGNDPSHTVVAGHGTVRLVGQAWVTLPKLLDFDRDWYIWLDQVGFHPDIAALWEAVPFSWLVDWFVPIGAMLESAVGNWYNPILHMQGTLTYRVLCDMDLYVPSPLGRPQFNAGGARGQKEGHGTFKLYSRNPIGGTVDSRSASLPMFRLPIPDPRKCGILTDVAGIDYVEWARYHKSRQKSGVTTKKRIFL